MSKQEEKKNTPGTGLVSERAIRFEGRKVPGANCIAGLKSLTGPPIHQGLSIHKTPKTGRSAGRGEGPEMEPGRAGGPEARPPWAPVVRPEAAAAGRREAQG